MSSYDFSTQYSLLNAAQKSAVDSIYGPLMIVAGPGTGKTQTLALRTANILRQSGVSPQNILITTFTEAGVVAIRERLIRLIGPAGRDVRVSTIHGFCQSILDSYPDEFASERAESKIDDVDAYRLIERLLDTGEYPDLVSENDTYYYSESILKAISTLKRESIPPELLPAMIDDEEKRLADELANFLSEHPRSKGERQKLDHAKVIAKQRTLSRMYRAYISELKAKKLYDYDDMIQVVGARLRTDRAFALAVAENIQFIMIDEFQDSNRGQNQVMDSIASASDVPNIAVVGDDDQSIYRFQGASVTNAFTFLEKYPTAVKVVLTENYRSSGEILASSSVLIGNNQLRVSRFDAAFTKVLEAKRTFEMSAIQANTYVDDLAEKSAVAEQIRGYLASGIRACEIAILLRKNADVESWLAYLRSSGLIAENAGKSDVFASRYVMLLIDMIAIFSDRQGSDSAMANILRSGLFPISARAILDVMRALGNANYTRRNTWKLYDALCDQDFISKSLAGRRPSQDQLALGENPIERDENAEAFMQLAEKIQMISQSPLRIVASQWLHLLLAESGFITYVEREGNLDDLQDVLAFVRWWDDLTSRSGMTVESMLSRLDDMREYGLSLERSRLAVGQNALQIMTVHRAKGLEYDAVFVPMMSEKKWDKKGRGSPIRLPLAVTGSVGSLKDFSDIDHDTEDARRLAYVAMTRARQFLHLSCPLSDNGKPSLASQFMSETQLPMLVSNRVATAEDIRLSVGLVGMSRDIESELAYLGEILQTYRLSPSHLNTFIDKGPQAFYRDVILKIPQDDMTSAWFGNAYHKALELW